MAMSRVRDAARPGPARAARSTNWLPILSLLLSLSAVFLFSCMCGFMDPQALPLTFAGAGIAWYSFVAVKRTSVIDRVFSVLCVILTTLILGKHLLDALWLGHGAMFG
jgi:hypothetical protein